MLPGSARGPGTFSLSGPESRWLNRLSEQAELLAEDEGTFIEEVTSTIDRDKVRLDQYGLDL